MRKVDLAVIGAGGRGFEYSNYFKDYPEVGRVVAVAEPDPVRRSSFASIHGIAPDKCFDSWEKLLVAPKIADAVIIATQDDMHFAPACRSMDLGYHILLEKPMSNKPEECIRLGELSQKHDKTVTVCHVLRYTPFFTKIKSLLDGGRIGKLVSIQHNENVGYYHYAHSFVRGNWRNSDISSPMILAKSCHDMDLMLWLAGSDCEYVSSYGSLTYFKRENAPIGSTKRCVDGCVVESECPFSALKIYRKEKKGWPVSAITHDLSEKGIMKALKEGPYGRCVYHCDNNVVDHQVASLEFGNGVTAVFTMCAFTPKISRTIKLMGTEGIIRGHMENSEIKLTRFDMKEPVQIDIEVPEFGHAGGDYGLMKYFVDLLSRENAQRTALTSASVSVQSHMMAFACEESRQSKSNIDLKAYINKNG